MATVRHEMSTTPRSRQEILHHADELAKRFEEYEPSPDDEIDVDEYLQRRAAPPQDWRDSDARRPPDQRD
jgi:hypothetical protein